jgi:hypothetical protein
LSGWLAGPDGRELPPSRRDIQVLISPRNTTNNGMKTFRPGRSGRTAHNLP